MECADIECRGARDQAVVSHVAFHPNLDRGDNGVAIPAEYHDAILEMFRVPNGDGGEAGSGMGLAIVKRRAPWPVVAIT